MGFSIAQISDLARQMQFTPHEQRANQLAAAEELLLQIDPAKAYPFDFLVFRITGYHPKASAGSLDVADDGFTGQLITGMAIQHDLGLLVEQVSDGLNIQVDGLGEPVLTIEQVCEQFNASEKSVQRWRRRGLAARRFIFPDGKKRVGFLAASVERFFSIHRDRVACVANFDPVSEPEREKILTAARRLVAAGNCAEEIFRRIAAKLNRSSLTIAHIIGEFDRLNPELAIIKHAAVELAATERAAILDGYQHDRSLADLAAALGRPRAAIFRVLLEDRIAKLARWNVKFIDDVLYHQPNAADAVDQIARGGELDEQPRPEDQRLPKGLPSYIQSLYRHPLLTPARERGLFLKFNFHKYQFETLRRDLDAQRVGWRDVDKLESHLKLAVATKNDIVAANLRLVISVARKHLPASSDSQSLMDLVSDGNVTLMRAADAFDFHRGTRFSTYATLALMKEFARAVPAGVRRRNLSLLMDVPDAREAPVSDRLAERDHVRQLLAHLPERERTILRAHYGVADDSGAPPVTLEQLGRDLQLSKERLRQIERAALAKLRATATE